MAVTSLLLNISLILQHIKFNFTIYYFVKILYELVIIIAVIIYTCTIFYLRFY